MRTKRDVNKRTKQRKALLSFYLIYTINLIDWKLFRKRDQLRHHFMLPAEGSVTTLITYVNSALFTIILILKYKIVVVVVLYKDNEI